MSNYPGARRQSSNQFRRLPRGSSSRRRQQQGSATGSFQDPLLLRNDNGGPSFYPGAPPAPSSGSPRGDVELMDTIGGHYPPHGVQQAAGSSMTYRPPAVQDSVAQRQRDYPEARRAYVQQQHQHPAHSILRSTDYNRNPAIDEANQLLAHGLCCCQCVRTQELGFTEQCGAFQSILQPGLHFMLWPINTISGRLSLRVQQADVTCESCSSDRVFCHITTSVLYRVSVTRSYEAFYRLPDSRKTIEQCVLDSIQSIVPGMTLDRIFSSKSEIALSVSSRLKQQMYEFGYDICEVLVTNISPNTMVRQSMDEIAASRAIKLANAHTAEQNKFVTVKKAEGNAERSHLMGTAVAKGRQAIVEGMKESVNLFTDVDVRVMNPPSNNDVMNLLLVTQYLDLLHVVKPERVIQQHEPATVAKLQAGLV